MGEVTELTRTICECFIHTFRYQHGADRQVGRRKRLGNTHGGWADVHGLCAKWLTRAPEAADHLIVDKGNIVLVEYLLNTWIVIFRRYDDPTRP